jgi:hypothetical protein
MDRKTSIGCTLAIILALIGCSLWVRQSIQENTSAVLSDLERR